MLAIQSRRCLIVAAATILATTTLACGDEGKDEIGGDPDEDSMSSGDGDGDTEPPGDGDGDGQGDGDGEGDGDGDLPSDLPAGDGDGEPAGDGDGEPAGDGDGEPAGDGDGEPAGDGDGEPAGDGDGEPAPECMVWELTYDLTGSKFIIADTPLKLGNQVNTVAEPYDAYDHIGPGTFVLRFRDVDGEPGEVAFMHSYSMALHFQVNASGARVKTDLDGSAGPEECGITRGTLDGTTVAWKPAAIVGYHSKGQIFCKGNFCKLAMLPKNKAKKMDEITDQPVSDFVFDATLSTFTMAKTVIEKDARSTSSWIYAGTETGRELIAAPACLCE